MFSARIARVYAGKRVLVIGGGHSAANVLLDLARLAETDGPLRMTWALRGKSSERVFGGGAADQLPARGKLGSDLKAACRDRPADARDRHLPPSASRATDGASACTGSNGDGPRSSARSTASSSRPGSVPISP